MVRLICALVLVLLIASPSLAQRSPVGTYELVYQVIEVGGAPIETMGDIPHGYLVFTPTRMITLYTTDNRNFGTSVAEKAALFDTLVGWAGVYHVEESKVIVTVDASFVEHMNGTTRVYTWQLLGNRFTLTSGPMPYLRDPSKTMVRQAVWDKVE